MSRRTCEIAALLMLCLAPPGAAIAQTSPPTGAVVTDTDAYLLLPQELIAGPVVEVASISPLGRNAAVLRRSFRISAINLPSAAQLNPPMPAIEQELLFWNEGSRRAISLWTSGLSLVRCSLSDWMPETESLFAVVDQPLPPDPQHPERGRLHDWKLLLLGNGIQRAVVLPLPVGQFEEVSVQVAPGRPAAVVRMQPSEPGRRSLFQAVFPNGRMGARFELPDATNQSIAWNRDGEAVYLSAGADGAQVWKSVDLRTGATKPIASGAVSGADRKTEKSNLPFHMMSARQKISQGETVDAVHPLWLESNVHSEFPRALVAGDAVEGALLPDGQGVVYRAESSFWFRPLLKMNKALFLTQRQAAERAVALSKAKQLGLAALMYAEDNDETLPGPDGLTDKLLPYTLNESLFDGFTYTFAGGRLADVASPSETQLGFVTGPGGRAVVFVDGHAKWIPDR